jgi:RND family efflux transporter MFP subunit
VADSVVKSSELNVEWCKVIAPISGKISSKEITPGNMLTGGPGQNTTTITTIKSVDPIYCYVDADETRVLKYQRLAKENKRASAEQATLPCYMGLGDETGFPHEGYIDFVDNRINLTTATRRARGVFKNTDGTLIPGFFARFRVAGEELHNALLVMDDSVGNDQDKKYLYVMHPDKTVERRTVEVGPLVGELRVIRSNLSAEDLVLVNGISSLAMVRPGGTVDPTAVPMPEHRLAAAASQAATKAAQTAPTTQATPMTSAPAETQPRGASATEAIR